MTPMTDYPAAIIYVGYAYTHVGDGDYELPDSEWSDNTININSLNPWEYVPLIVDPNWTPVPPPAPPPPVQGCDLPPAMNAARIKADLDAEQAATIEMHRWFLRRSMTR